MRQLQFFTTAELAAMRDRTASRRYSPAREEFRREHHRHRVWGLARRHAERLRRVSGASRAPEPTPAPSVPVPAEAPAPNRPAAQESTSQPRPPMTPVPSRRSPAAFALERALRAGSEVGRPSSAVSPSVRCLPGTAGVARPSAAASLSARCLPGVSGVGRPSAAVSPSARCLPAASEVSRPSPAGFVPERPSAEVSTRVRPLSAAPAPGRSSVVASEPERCSVRGAGHRDRPPAVSRAAPESRVITAGEGDARDCPMPASPECARREPERNARRSRLACPPVQHRYRRKNAVKSDRATQRHSILETAAVGSADNRRGPPKGSSGDMRI